MAKLGANGSIYKTTLKTAHNNDKYGNQYDIIPKKDAVFGFCKHLKYGNGTLGNTYFGVNRIVKEYFNEDIDIFDDYSYGEINTAIEMVEQDQQNAGIYDSTSFEEIYDNYPVLMDYDTKGGYVGTLANENGWTP